MIIFFCPQRRNNIKYEKKEKREQQAQREAERDVTSLELYVINV